MPAIKTEVVVLTRYYRIEGEIDLIPGARMTDFMNEARRFVVVTDATVTDLSGKELVRGEFVNVLVDNIEVILPAESVIR